MGHNSGDYIHLVAEFEKRVFADRAEFLGDPDFVDIPAALTSKAYAASRAAGIRLDSRTPPERVTHGTPREREETAHFSIVDRRGNAAACTTTLNGSYGSGIVERGAGFLLSNEMDAFSSRIRAASAAQSRNDPARLWSARQADYLPVDRGAEQPAAGGDEAVMDGHGIHLYLRELLPVGR